MVSATDLKNGVTFLSGNEPWKVVKYHLIKVGRGGAIVRVTAKNLIHGTLEDKTMSSNVKVDLVATSKRKLQYLYNDGAVATFMDPTTYEQTEVAVKVLSDELPYIKEGGEVDILFWTDDGVERPLSVDIPPKVDLKVAETPPGVKGNSASNMYKEALLENGLRTRVPLFIKEGETVRIDTRTGSYVERSSKQ